MSGIIEALFKALPELESAKKNAANPHLKSKYANLTAVMAAVEPIRQYGLWYRQVVHDRNDGACVETIYLHESGQELSAGLTFVKAEKQNPQGFGSALTYCRRYSLQCAFGLDAEDDDGHVASKPAPPPEPELSDSDLALIDAIEACNTADDLDKWTADHGPSVAKSPNADTIRARFKTRRAQINPPQKKAA